MVVLYIISLIMLVITSLKWATQHLGDSHERYGLWVLFWLAVVATLYHYL